MIVPPQLQNREFRFIIIRDNCKEPQEAKWQEYNNYVYFHPKIKQTKNAGILCGKGHLIVLDVDDVELLMEMDDRCNTFSVRTGSGKRHYYFTCDETFDKSYYVLSGKRGELRVKNSQVLIPGSTHPNGNKYEVFCDKKIRNTTKEELKTLLGDLLFKNGMMVDTTRSCKEWQEVCGMVQAGYNFDECDMEMKALGYEKWITSGESYRTLVYCNAIKTIKSKSNQDIIKGNIF